MTAVSKSPPFCIPQIWPEGPDGVLFHKYTPSGAEITLYMRGRCVGISLHHVSTGSSGYLLVSNDPYNPGPSNIESSRG